MPDLRHTLFAALAAVALSACNPPDPGASATPEASADGDSTVVAIVDGTSITLSELDAWIKDQLLDEELRGKNPAAQHDFRAERLDQLVRDRVIAAAARERGVTRDALLAESRKVATVDDAAVRAFYDKNKDRLGGAEYEQVAPRIRQHLESKESRSVERAFVDSLLEDADVQIQFEAPRVQVAAQGPARGPDDAPVTIIEFSDFQCPFCARAGPTVKQVLARYPEQVRFVYRHYPLGSIHPRAHAAAVASACAAEQGKFWEYHDLLFANAKKLADEDLAGYAEQAGADAAAFSQCVTEGRFDAEVERDIAAGRAAGVTGTPTFFINGRMLGGAQPLDEFVRVIEEELARGGSPS